VSSRAGRNPGVSPMFGKSTKKKKKRVDPKNRVFTDRPRKVFRHYIGTSELAFSAFFVMFTVAMGAWFFLQRDNYNADDRDISMEILLAQQVEDHLWEPPLKRWTEPGAFGEMPVGGGAAPAIDLKIFPASVLSDGWVDDSRVEVFNKDNLADKINGQETQYKAYGFQSLHFLGITQPDKDLVVNIELYDMGSFQNALGIFAAQRTAGSTVEKHGNAYLYLTEVGALGIADKYYFKFSGNQESELIRAHALKVVQDFAGSLDNSSMPKGFALLADLGVDFAGIEYVPEDVFKYAFAKDFWFGRPAGDSKRAYFVHDAASEEEAVKLIDQILEEHAWDYTLVSREGTRAVMQHNFLKNYFSIDHSGTLVYGVDQAPDEQDASQSLETLAAKLFDEAA
jgi:hypothetical protein